jgi:hypothetical protein
MSRSRWIGGDPAQWEIERLADLKCQINAVHDATDARIDRAERAVDQLAFAREQLLALSMVMYEMARDQELGGAYDVVDLLHELTSMIRDIRVNKTVDRLKGVGKP